MTQYIHAHMHANIYIHIICQKHIYSSFIILFYGSLIQYSFYKWNKMKNSCINQGSSFGEKKKRQTILCFKYMWPHVHCGRRLRRQLWAIQVSIPNFQVSSWGPKISLCDTGSPDSMDVTLSNLIIEIMDDYTPNSLRYDFTHEKRFTYIQKECINERHLVIAKSKIAQSQSKKLLEPRYEPGHCEIFTLNPSTNWLLTIRWD